MTYGVARTDAFDFARVIDRTFATFRDNFRNFFVVAVCLAGAPAMLGQFILFAVPPTSPDGAMASIIRVGIQFFGGILALVLQGTLIWGTVTYLNGRRAPMREVLGVGLRKFLPLLGLGICLSVAVGFGFLLLIVPGVILLVMWAVTAPALVVESTGVFGAFLRSAQLTKGRRWSVLGLSLLFWIATSVVSGVSGVFMGVILLSSGQFPGGAAAHGFNGVSLALATVGALVTGLLAAIAAMLAAVGVGVLYVELRRAREGVAPQQVADVFD